MSLKEVVLKLHNCAVQSEEDEDLVVLTIPSEGLSDSNVLCVREDDVETVLKSMPQEDKRKVFLLSESDRKKILAVDVNSPKMDSLVVGIIEDNYWGKIGSKNVPAPEFQFCSMNMEDMEKLDKKR